MARRSSTAIDLIFLEVLAIILVTYCFRGATSLCDGIMHLSKIRTMLENLNTCGSFPRWNPYWYFGIPTWRIYSPLSYYIMASLGWIFHLSLVEIVMLWTYLVFSVATISTYLLAGEMGLKRLGRFTSSVLFLTSFNLISYWGIGSYPNITGIAFSPLTMSLYMRAVKRRTLRSILAAGLAFSAVLLTYFMYAVIVTLFIVILSALMILRDPSLLFIPRGPQQPPKYTLTLPKILFSVILVAGCLSMWWALPFLITYISAPSIPGGTGYGVPERSLIDQLIMLVGVYVNIDTPGVGHFILAVVACLMVFAKRKVKYLDAPLCFITAFFFSLAPWLRIPTGPLFWWRFTLYLSLFASVCGGIPLTPSEVSMKGSLIRILKAAQVEEPKARFTRS